MIKINFILHVLLLVCVFGLTQSNVDLQCVPLRNCQKLLNLLKQPINENTIQILRTAQCGFEGNSPQVWCAKVSAPSCQTPDGHPGTCRPIKECEPFVQLLQSPNGLSTDIITYLQKSQCKEPNVQTQTITICCPTDQKNLLTKQPIISTESPTPLPLINTEPAEPQDRPSFLPANDECGLQAANKIIGGKVTEIDEFPWTALVEYHLKARVSTACAGTLISAKYVVTAAHCADDYAIRVAGNPTNVILGEFDKSTARDCINYLGIEDCADPPLKVPIEKVIIHDQWYTRPKAQINHDIALLRLGYSVRFTDFIKPICLPSSSLIIGEKEKLVVAGWGQTENGAPSSVKLKTTITMANRDLCIQKYMSDKKVMVGDGEICVGGEEGKDSCSGDSGGPLMVSVNTLGSGVWFLIGIVSFGSNQPCGIKDYPALYTYLPKYIDWIYRTVES